MSNEKVTTYSPDSLVYCQKCGQGRLILRDRVCQFCRETKDYRKKNNKKEKSK